MFAILSDTIRIATQQDAWSSRRDYPEVNGLMSEMERRTGRRTGRWAHSDGRTRR
ncbi:hypothetical protein [uncultured Roseobacter sp.]|uniref:hypothetical protein n=1 Tax=uncultured Roseobacter sp. TaxID=114847 RepID=UPI00261B275B|nr:hypothetical protein [uncultured Roseobacter sp.]